MINKVYIVTDIDNLILAVFDNYESASLYRDTITHKMSIIETHNVRE